MIEGVPDIGIFIRRILQLDNRNGQAVDKYHQIRPPQLLSAGHGKLVDHQKLIVARMLKIYQLGVIMLLFITFAILNLYTFQQKLVKGTVVVGQDR